MLTPIEEKGLRDILNDFLDSDLFSLADTVTKKLLEAKDRSDAIDTIIRCLEKPSDLLKRQRVRKRALFSYLQKKRPVSPECTKADLVKMCLEAWKSVEKCQASDYENSPKTEEKQCPPEDWLSQMGIEFAKWFFPIYNNLQGFGPEHFWSNCTLIGTLQVVSDVKEVRIVGADEVATFLCGLITGYNFYFDANAKYDSIVCEQDPHGLIKIVISGVVHQLSCCIGLFDCAFGLVRNPAFDNNWKIKFIDMKIHVMIPGQPVLMPTCQLLSIDQRA